VEDPSVLPKWTYDGSSTGQAPGEDSEVILYPQAIFRDPFPIWFVNWLLVGVSGGVVILWKKSVVT
jgi:hypothetical protein